MRSTTEGIYGFEEEKQFALFSSNMATLFTWSTVNRTLFLV